ncbi:MAG: hypothetical protein WDN69_03010 [Aliidongia sp.]
MNDDSIYVNPDQVSLQKSSEGHGDNATEIVFGAADKVVVKGDIDYIAFQLFPTGVR